MLVYIFLGYGIKSKKDTDVNEILYGEKKEPEAGLNDSVQEETDPENHETSFCADEPMSTSIIETTSADAESSDDGKHYAFDIDEKEMAERAVIFSNFYKDGVREMFED